MPGMSQGFTLTPGLLTRDDINNLLAPVNDSIDGVAHGLLLDRFVPHRARPTQGSRARWAVVLWVKTGGPSAC